MTAEPIELLAFDASNACTACGRKDSLERRWCSLRHPGLRVQPGAGDMPMFPHLHVACDGCGRAFATVSARVWSDTGT